MSFTILASLGVLGALALLFGAGLGYAGIKFKVLEDERVGAVRELLPSANCGGCGFAGCDGMASAIVNDGLSPLKCPALKAENVQLIAGIMGSSAEAPERRVAFVKCRGTTEVCKYNYKYEGLADCAAAGALAAGGAKSCAYGCLGLGSCAAACKFGAITMKDGLSVVHREKCTACGMCAAACPRGIIEILPYSAEARVFCSSRDNGKTSRANCSLSCVGCKLCEKACEYGAVRVENFLASTDYAKCVNCGKCAEACKSKVIG
ncbi:MAG: RnfABCDGE type electron transport complex subunit B [Clostridiales bacterium]|jgi:electron transport complex protein RnfB|nr:RnfABCDGE type electron transport complex subunit B [Clostridiales bacterium]